VVYNMVWVVHDAYEKCHQWILPDLIEWVSTHNFTKFSFQYDRLSELTTYLDCR